MNQSATGVGARGNCEASIAAEAVDERGGIRSRSGKWKACCTLNLLLTLLSAGCHSLGLGASLSQNLEPVTVSDTKSVAPAGSDRVTGGGRRTAAPVAMTSADEEVAGEPEEPVAVAESQPPLAEPVDQASPSAAGFALPRTDVLSGGDLRAASDSFGGKFSFAP